MRSPGPSSAGVDLGQRGLAVAGVDEQPVGQHLEPFADPLDLRRALLVATVAETHLEHLASGVLGDQRRRRTLGHDLAVVHHDEPVAELLGLVHEVRGEHQRGAAFLELVELVPQQVARLRIETGGRLVEQQQVGLVDQRAGDAHPPLLPAGQGVDLAVGAVAELDEVEQFGGPLARRRDG